MKPLVSTAVALRGTTLIESSAGTGKTYTITTLFLRLLLEQRLEVSQILVVTFTRAATAELRDRIRRRLVDAISAIDHGGADHDTALAELIAQSRARDALGADRAWLAQALRDFDEAAICTIHAFCQRTLTEHAFESQSPFEISLVEADAPLLQELAADFWAKNAYTASPELVVELQDKQVGPKSLLALARKALRDPRMPVLPDAPVEQALALAPFVAARERAALLWSQQRTAVLAELSVPERLHKTRYPLDALDDWAADLDRLSSCDPQTLPACAEKLTEASLRDSTRKGRAALAHPFFTAMTELWAAAEAVRNELRGRVLALRRGLCDYARSEIVRRHRDLGVHGFDDLLQALRSALEGPGGTALAERVVKRHPAALIDEFQDTDPVQYEIFQRLYQGSGRCLFLIGDPKQAIYGFRGADVFAYLQAAREAQQAAYTLGVNHRSDPRLVEAVNTLFERARLPFVFPEIQFNRVSHKPDAREHMPLNEPALELLFISAASVDPHKPDDAINRGWGNDHVPVLIANEIVQLLHSSRGAAPASTLDGKALQPRDIAVLCRTNAQARATRDALAALGVPTVLDGDSSVFETETADELGRVLWAVARPSDPRKLGAALASAILGVRGEALQQMRSDESGIELWLERLARWNQLWHERGFTQMLHVLLEEASVQRNLLSRSDGERRLTDLLHLAELLHQAAVQQHLGPLALLHWFTQMQADAEPGNGMAAESAQIRLEHDEHALRLTTMHRSKGLEYPIVFCPFLWSARIGGDKDVCFHDRDDSDRAKLDLGSRDYDRHKLDAEREDAAEGMRLLYVALTRAKHRCYVVWGRFERARSPLGYLLHQAPNGAPTPATVEARLKDMSERALRAELDALRDASHGTIGVRDLSRQVPPRFTLDEPRPGALSARRATRVLRNAPRLSSFSRLTAESTHATSPHADDGADHDETTQAVASELAQPAQGTQRAPVVLAEFPLGARPGTLIHSVFEHIDFTRTDPGELPEQAARWLTAYGQQKDAYLEPLVQGIDAVLRTPLDAADPPLTLGRIARGQRVSELEFTLSTQLASSRLTPAKLAAVFERFGAPAQAPDYAERLGGLRVLPPSEFMKGFIDLVFRDGERFYLVDYKSNFLGAFASDYAAAQMLDAMREHHYFLQYHLYALALHRYLTLRLPNYDYERCFGGAYYLFVRGMAPEHAHRTGVFFDRPKLALLEALAAVLGDAGNDTAPALRGDAEAAT